ncbi:MAG: NADH-quinone oxidoreductase subunit NuoG [Gammaproteobacteria bacterium]
MSEDLVNIEVNGIPLKARKGSMLIEATDNAGIKVPRFCYHEKLSVAANCRMCLVEVEKAPKPLPACATPVSEGMKVFTQSPKALGAQKGTMEFLLINHPLDCPICDQGGECELQDVAMGYGEDISRYTENKRVVKDKDIGPLIETEMTRCIHCTRCVRFGEEVAGLRELGATGRGEFMKIGTYVEKSVSSEMSGNVIDLCPVGALTAKPSRFRARAWEVIQHASIAPHDSVGSNLYLHTLRGEVIRAVPRDNEGINECWISDRDRFSYEALSHTDRVTRPLVKTNGQWQETDWESALETAAERLRSFPADDIGALLSASATLEEQYLAQKLMRGLGVTAIDHRLRENDFSDQAQRPLFPWLGMALQDLDALDAVLLVGADVRKDHPIIGHRLRKAALKGAAMMAINPRDFAFRFDLAAERIVDPLAMIRSLAGVAKVLGAKQPTALLDSATVGEAEQAMADRLKAGGKAAVFLGTIAAQHPAAAALRALVAAIAEQSGASFGYLPEAANTAGAWLAGAVPHRLPGGGMLAQGGLHAQAMLAQPRKAYLLLGVEPESDSADPAQAAEAMAAAEFVLAITPFAGEELRRHADMILPVATFAETSGTFVNLEGRWQSFNGATTPPGEARPGWKVLRVLGNLLGLGGFDQTSTEQVRDELKARFAEDLVFDNALELGKSYALPEISGSGLMRISGVGIYAQDMLVRRSSPLQQTVDGRKDGVWINPAEADRQGLGDAGRVNVRQGGAEAELELHLDESIPDGCAWIPMATEAGRQLGASFGLIELSRA